MEPEQALDEYFAHIDAQLAKQRLEAYVNHQNMAVNELIGVLALNVYRQTGDSDIFTSPIPINDLDQKTLMYLGLVEPDHTTIKVSRKLPTPFLTQFGKKIIDSVEVNTEKMSSGFLPTANLHPKL